MKKIMLLLICCFTLFALAGCDSAVGTWKFHEKTTATGTIIQVGSVVFGKEYTENYTVVVFEKDGTGTYTQDTLDLTYNFTWEEVDGVIKVTGDLIKFDAKIEDGYLVFKSADGGTYKLKK